MPQNLSRGGDQKVTDSSGTTTPWIEVSRSSRSSSEGLDKCKNHNTMDGHNKSGTSAIPQENSDQAPTCMTLESQVTVKNSNENEKSSSDSNEPSEKATLHETKIKKTTAKVAKNKRKFRQSGSKQSRDNPKNEDFLAESDSHGASSPEDSDVTQAKAGKKDNTRCLKPKKTTLRKHAKIDTDSDDFSDSTDDNKKTRKQNANVVQELKKSRKTTEAKSAGDAIIESALNKPGTVIHLRDVTVEQKAGVAQSAKPAEEETDQETTEEGVKGTKPEEKAERGSKAEFARLDHVWSSSSHRFVSKPSTEEKKSGQFDGYAFNVVRDFDYSNHYTQTVLHILSKPLKVAMVHVMRKVKGISLEEDTPHVDPNIVFLHLEEFRAYSKELRAKIKAKKYKSKVKDLRLAWQHLKVLVDFLDKDYDETKKSLYPLLESGKITFDLAWALFKSNEIVYFPTYDHELEPRAAKVEYVNKVRNKQV